MLDFYLDSPTCYVSTGLVVFHSYGTSVYIKSNICRCQMFVFFKLLKAFLFTPLREKKKQQLILFPSSLCSSCCIFLSLNNNVYSIHLHFHSAGCLWVWESHVTAAFCLLNVSIPPLPPLTELPAAPPECSLRGTCLIGSTKSRWTVTWRWSLWPPCWHYAYG